MKLRSVGLFAVERVASTAIPAVLSLLATTTPLLADKNKPPPPPASNTFSLTGSMNVTRFGHKTILLGNGLVLAVTGDATGANTAELYNPATGTWSLTGTPAVFHNNGSGHAPC